MNRFLLPLLGLACWLSASTAQAALSDPAQIQTEAYVNLVQADQGLEAGRLDEALAQYQVARDYYRQLASDFPSWKPRIVQYRKAYCDSQVTDIERRLNGGAPLEEAELAPLPVSEPAPQPKPVVVAEAEPSRDVRERSVEVDYLKSRIHSLESQLSDLDMLQDDLDAVQSEYDALNIKYTRIVESFTQAEAQLKEKSAGNASALADLQAELNAKDDQLKSLQQELEAKKQLDQVLNDMEANVNELREDNKLLQKEIKTLDAELDTAESRADKAEKVADKTKAELANNDNLAKQLKTAESRADKAEKAAGKAKAELKNNNNLAKQLKTAESDRKKAESELKKAKKRITKLLKAESSLKDAEGRAKKAEKDLQKARADLADADKKLTVAKRKPISTKADRIQDKPKVKSVEIIKEKPGVDPKEDHPAPVTEPFMATVPPKDIPRGTSPADYVRQLLQDGENDTALATVQQARKSQPADMNLILIEGIALIRLQRYEEAATMMIDLAKNNPRNAEVNATLGAAMMGAGFFDEARETLLIAVKLDKNLPECQYNLAQLYTFIDPISIKKARKYYKQARNLGLPADPNLEKALK